LAISATADSEPLSCLIGLLFQVRVTVTCLIDELKSLMAMVPVAPG